MARLLDREDDLADFEVFHFAGHWLARGDDLRPVDPPGHRQPAAADPAVPLSADLALAPFMETFRELLEMRYLWRGPIGLDNAKLVRFLGDDPHTPLDAAIARDPGGHGLLADGALPLSPSWGETGREASRVGPRRSLESVGFARSPPTLIAARSVPPHEGEGGLLMNLAAPHTHPLHAAHVRQNPLRQDLGRARRRRLTPNGEAILYIDLHLIHEVTTPQAFAGLRAARRPVRRPDRTLAVADHNIPDRGPGARRRRRGRPRGARCSCRRWSATSPNTASSSSPWAIRATASSMWSGPSRAAPSRA